MPKCPAKIPVHLRECSAMQCGGIDEALPIVQRVKILGWESRNRRRYLPESVAESDYEQISVNLNHPDGSSKPRVVQERFGWFEGVVKEADGLYGDLHYNPDHPYGKTFAWWAKHKPTKIGMSHDAIGTGRTENGTFIVERAKPANVDLVADSATTRGLYEAMDTALTPADGSDKLDDLALHIKNAVSAICADDALDITEKVKKIRAALKLLEDPEEEEEAEEESEMRKDGEEDEQKTKESLTRLAAKYPGVKKLFERLDKAEIALAVRDKNEQAHKLCQEAKLPAMAITTTFLGLLLEAKDEEAMRALIEDRKAIASVQKPRSIGPAGAQAGHIDNTTFAKMLKKDR